MHVCTRVAQCICTQSWGRCNYGAWWHSLERSSHSQSVHIWTSVCKRPNTLHMHIQTQRHQRQTQILFPFDFSPLPPSKKNVSIWQKISIISQYINYQFRKRENRVLFGFLYVGVCFCVMLWKDMRLSYWSFTRTLESESIQRTFEDSGLLMFSETLYHILPFHQLHFSIFYLFILSIIFLSHYFHVTS